MSEPKTVTIAPSVKAAVNGNTLTLVIELDEEGYISKSGKSKVHGTTSGFKMLPNGMTISLNVIG